MRLDQVEVRNIRPHVLLPQQILASRHKVGHQADDHSTGHARPCWQWLQKLEMSSRTVSTEFSRFPMGWKSYHFTCPFGLHDIQSRTFAVAHV